MSGMLMSERFVAVFPSLVRHLGSIESAAILQHMHWCGDESGDIRITVQQISDDTGIALRTVERRLRMLREEGYVTAERTASWDATLTYRIDTARLAVSSPADADIEQGGGQSGGLQPARMADSSFIEEEEDSLTLDSEVSKSRAREDDHATGALVPSMEPERHPSRPITTDWAPRGHYLRWLMHEYPHVNLPEAVRRFVGYHFGKRDTSHSWEAGLQGWVSRDEENYLATRLGGTDDLGIPYNQRPRTDIAAQPGDEDYVDPEELHAEMLRQIEEADRRAAQREREEQP